MNRLDNILTVDEFEISCDNILSSVNLLFVLRKIVASDNIQAETLLELENILAINDNESIISIQDCVHILEQKNSIIGFELIPLAEQCGFLGNHGILKILVVSNCENNKLLLTDSLVVTRFRS